MVGGQSSYLTEKETANLKESQIKAYRSVAAGKNLARKKRV